MDETRGPETTSPLLDDRLQFFNEHRDLILSWAALADEVAAAVDVELRRLGDEVRRVAGAAGEDLLVANRVAGDSWVAPMLHRASWSSGSMDGPDIAVGLGWDGRRVHPTPGAGAVLPYVGLVASRQTERGRALEAAVRPLADAQLVAPKRYKRGSVWIVYRTISAEADWYRDLPAWRAWVAGELVKTWRDAAGIVDRAVAATLPVASIDRLLDSSVDQGDVPPR